MDQRFSVFYGQSFSDFEYTLGAPEVIRHLGDVSAIRTDFDIHDFSDVFFANFEHTQVRVVSIINIVFLITRYLQNFERDQTVGQVLTKVY